MVYVTPHCKPAGAADAVVASILTPPSATSTLLLVEDISATKKQHNTAWHDTHDVNSD